jgi:hypothetical protein
MGKCSFVQSGADICCTELYNNSYNSFLMNFSNGILTIKKGDNQPLHEFSFESDEYPLYSSHYHLCGCDTYFCTISIYSEVEFILHYTVYGISKHYTLIKRYYLS